MDHIVTNHIFGPKNKAHFWRENLGFSKNTLCFVGENGLWVHDVFIYV